ncbi:hypothetical protein ZWY2020_014771 [Hordeum vulgare]|nr:hypothetical protein ZWY2020_014771 [Hordeum vulgare]
MDAPLEARNGGDDPGVAHLEERRAVGPGDGANLALELPHLRDADREESEPIKDEPGKGVMDNSIRLQRIAVYVP